MTRDTEARQLTDDDLEHLLNAAVQEEREGRLVHCDTEQELRQFLLRLRNERS